MSSVQTNPGSDVAFVFPGQGSQAVGMGLDLYQGSKAAKAIFEEVDDALGSNVSKIFFEGPEDELRKTINTQPGIMTVSLACLATMSEILGTEMMPVPSLVAGHSLGEYTALVASGALSAGDGVKLVRERSRLMQDASELADGGMAAILGMEESVLSSICIETGTEISNVNTADQIVISGERQAVEKAMGIASERGARRTVQLPVGGAFHSKLMRPAQEGLAKVVSELSFQTPHTPIVANCTGNPLTTIDEIKDELVSQLCSCVRWKETVDYMTGFGINKYYEIGPGKVLAGLVKRMNENADAINVSDLESINSLRSA